MKNSDYEVVIKNIVEQINECESVLSQYYSSHDFSKMSVQHINSTITSCRKLHSNMDKFVGSDLYHLIGMANLNAAQMSKIVKLTKELLKYRDDVKFFASYNTIPIPKRNSGAYKLSSGVELIKEV